MVVLPFIVGPIKFSDDLWGIVCAPNAKQVFPYLFTHPNRLVNIISAYFIGGSTCGSSVYFIDPSFLEALIIQIMQAVFLSLFFVLSIPYKKGEPTTYHKIFRMLFLSLLLYIILRFVEIHIFYPAFPLWGADDLITFLPHYSLPQAIWHAFINDPGLFSRTDAHTWLIAGRISLFLYALLAFIVSYVFVFVLHYGFKSQPTKKHRKQSLRKT